MPDPASPRLTMAILIEAGILAQFSRAWIEHASPDRLTYAQLSVLLHLNRLQVQQTPLQLAHAMQQPKTTMTHVVATLEKKGFVTLEPNPDDGRSKLVTLTKAGGQAVQDTMQAVMPVVDEVAAEYDPEDLQTILAGLSDLRAKLDLKRPD